MNRIAFSCPARIRALGFATLTLAACAGAARVATETPVGVPPALIVGEFEDDYGGRYVIGAAEWRHGATARYRIVRWNPADRYAIAQNAPGNASAPGKWTRIDWMALDMPPYAWAYCFTAYDAPSPAAAESAGVARREAPRTGCNGHPFSRMRRVTPDTGRAG